MSTVGFINVRDAQAALSAIIWSLRDAIAKGNTPYEKDVMEMWKRHLLVAEAMITDIQATMQDEWEQELKDANDMIP